LNMKGICWNETIRQGVIVWKKANDKMCTVGIVRRGRLWGDWGGDYCIECPYFITSEVILAFKWYQHILKELAKHLGISIDKLYEISTGDVI